MWGSGVLQSVGELLDEELGIEFTEAKKRQTENEESGGNRRLEHSGN